MAFADMRRRDHDGAGDPAHCVKRLRTGSFPVYSEQR